MSVEASPYTYSQSSEMELLKYHHTTQPSFNCASLLYQFRFAHSTILLILVKVPDPIPKHKALVYVWGGTSGTNTRSFSFCWRMLKQRRCSADPGWRWWGVFSGVSSGVSSHYHVEPWQTDSLALSWCNGNALTQWVSPERQHGWWPWVSRARE